MLMTFYVAVLAVLLLQAHAQPGFISIDCGAEAGVNYTDTLGINYVSDANFTNTGVRSTISSEEISRHSQRQLLRLRSFPEGKRNCYKISVTRGSKYLIRTLFLYGNYDVRNMSPQFDLHLGPNLWDTVTIHNASSYQSNEIIHVPLQDFVQICLVNTGNGTPFITAIELRILKNNTYVTESGSLKRYRRYDLGSNRSYRYSVDVYDRFWYVWDKKNWTKLSASIPDNSLIENDYRLGATIMSTAVTPANGSAPLVISWEAENETEEFYMYMHFTEIQVLTTNQTRQFNIRRNGESGWWFQNFSPLYHNVTTLYTPSAISGKVITYSLEMTKNSTLPPIINAIEIYKLKQFHQSETFQEDVDAITSIKSVYGLTRDWEGDPCAPAAYLWDGLNCTYGDNEVPRITTLNLGSSGLSGKINPSISKLTMLENLDLSNNNLSGEVPDFLIQLQHLKILNLEKNNLSGSIPSSLIAKSHEGSLSLSVGQNPNLCESGQCNETKKKNIVTPIVVSICGVLILLIAVAILWICKRKKSKDSVAVNHQNKISQQSTEKDDSFLQHKSQMYSYIDVLQITNNFNRIIGKGGFGTVYLGFIDETPVAVKMLSPSAVHGYQQFQAEVKVLIRVHHKNLTSLIGYCNEGTNKALIYEYMAKGNLREHLSGKYNESPFLSWKERLRVAVDAALGLEYLQNGCKPPIIHRDVKSANIFREPHGRTFRRSSSKTFVTASSIPMDEDENGGDSDQRPLHEQQEQQQQQPQASGLHVPSGQEEAGSKSLGKRPLSNVESLGNPASTIGAASVDANSTSSLLRNADMNKAPASADVDSKPPAKGIMGKVRRKSGILSSSSGQLQEVDSATGELTRKKSNLRNLVKFDIPEDSRRATLHLKAKKAQMTVQRAGTKVRRQKIKDGLVVKMERMLVRVDAAAEVPEDFDENVNQRVVSRVKEKWREYMIVCRHNHVNDAEFVLQFYQTRVIPEIENAGAGKKAAYEIPLGKKTCKVNLYSSLDKSMVVSSPGSRETLIFIMQARTASNAVEWYTFLRNVLGWQRASELQISIPDMSLSIRIANPFEKLEASQNKVHDADNIEEALLKTMQEEQAVAQELIRRCLDQLQDAPEWADVLESWIKDQRIGLAWKRYDRLEWIHGANERKMYGTIAMLKSHELELRPKTHYPTTAVTRKKHKTLTEPVPVEGFLIRLTGQRGRAQRLGLMYHKQLYFASHDQYLVFSRPTKVTPPPPPRLPASENANVPTAKAVKDAVPESWAVNPYATQDGQIEWLMEGHSGTTEAKRLHDEDAADEAARKEQNLLNCDGYINLADVVKVRKAQLGASPADQDLEEGSDVDFDEEVDDSMRNDGATSDLDIDRTLELVMKNGLIIRLQAADKARRKEWIQHLRALTKYWKHRTASDIALYKSTRSRNLSALKIDEETEAHVGQFARKWEVTQSFASPQLYNMCGIACCRSIHMSGMLYRKPRIHAPFTRCSVLLTAGTLLIFRDVLRSRVGKQLAHIHHERIANLDLKDCYIYSGLLTENDLLYQNQTFDANKPGHHALPRIYLEDGWTSTDEDVMTTFVIWHGKAKSWFRAEEGAGGGEQNRKEGKRTKLKRVAKLGSKGRSVVFRARSRAERDHWVLAIQNEIERIQGDNADFRLEESGDKGTSNDSVSRSNTGT